MTDASAFGLGDATDASAEDATDASAFGLGDATDASAFGLGGGYGPGRRIRIRRPGPYPRGGSGGGPSPPRLNYSSSENWLIIRALANSLIRISFLVIP